MPTDGRHRRHLGLEGLYNIRDLGGYETEDGRRTRWRTFFRSDSMHDVPIRARAALLDYGVRRVIDLRTNGELEAYPNVFAGSPDVEYTHVNVLGDIPIEQMMSTRLFDLGARSIAAWYSGILDERAERFGAAVSSLAEPGALPAVYHCHGGKDRTGLISALLLSVAGVPREAIADDYALSASYVIDSFFTSGVLDGLSPDEYTVVDFQRDYCPPEAMLATLQHLDTTYGGPVDYLRTIGVTNEEIETLRNALVDYAEEPLP